MNGTHLRSIPGFLAVLAAFVAVGALTGWLVGASETPVVAAIIPLVFGLIAAVGFGYAEAAAQLKGIQELAASDAPDVSARLRLLLGRQSTERLKLPAFWSIAVVAFCLACFLGVTAGVQRRVPSYPPLAVLVGTTNGPTTQEAAELHAFRLALMRQNLPQADVREIFLQAIAPFYSDPKYAAGGALADVRIDAIRQAVTRMLAGAQTASGRGRGPASDTTPK